MNTYDGMQTLIIFATLLLLVKPVGTFMAKVYQGKRTLLSSILYPAISFTTKTNRQASSGETAASYFTQMVGLWGARLCLHCHRHGPGHCLYPRFRPVQDHASRQLLSRHEPWHPLLPAGQDGDHNAR